MTSTPIFKEIIAEAHRRTQIKVELAAYLELYKATHCKHGVRRNIDSYNPMECNDCAAKD